MKLAWIEWDDSHSGRGWQDIDVARSNCEQLLCRSVGWVIAETRTHVTLAGSVAFGGTDGAPSQVSGEITIPKCSIVRRRGLRG